MSEGKIVRWEIVRTHTHTQMVSLSSSSMEAAEPAAPAADPCAHKTKELAQMARPFPSIVSRMVAINQSMQRDATSTARLSSQLRAAEMQMMPLRNQY